MDNKKVDLDLDIENYEYQDILNLFDIDKSLSDNEIKKAKRKVLLMHPDKSGLDKKYFLFFSSAFKILHSVYQFNMKTKININENTEYLAEKDEYNQELIDNLNKKYNKKEFNRWFNEMFDKIKIDNEFQETGYGDWLKTTDDDYVECKNRNEMNALIDKKKHNLRSIIKYKDINEFNSSGYNDLTNSKPEEYSCELFSKLQFEDLSASLTS